MIRPPLLPPFMADANAPPVAAEPMAAPVVPPEPLFDEPMSAPAAGPLPAAPQEELEQSRLSKFLELFALGAALGAGPQGGGAGILQGISQAREQQKAEREERAATAVRQQQALQAAAIQEQRRQAEQQKQRLDYIKEAQKAAQAARTPEEHEQIVALYERASGQILGAALRPGVLRRLVPYNGPTAKTDAQKVVEDVKAGKYGEEILSNPNTVIRGKLGTEIVQRTWPEWQEMAEVTTVIGPQNKPTVVSKGDATTQPIYDRLKAIWIADKKREPDEKEDYVLWNQATKEAAKVRMLDDRPRVTVNVPGQLPAKTQTRIDTTARAFGNESVVKNTAKIAEGYAFAKSMSDTTTNPADDQALIYAFAKAMDPDSVVREGEYNTVQKYAQSWADTFKFNAARVFSNTHFLTPESRRNMKRTIERKYLASKQQYDNIKRSYAKRINKITGQQDGEDYLIEYEGGFPEQSGQSSQTPTVGGEYQHPTLGRVRVVGVNPDGSAKVERVIQ